MAHDINDEAEQLDALKGWWKKYGTTLCVIILLVLAGIFGWNAWQKHTANKYAAASRMYDQLDEMTSNQTSMNNQQRAQVNQLVSQLVQNYGNTRYADLARLIQARVAVDAGDMNTASASLQQLVDSTQDSFTKSIAKIDLARVQVDMKQYDKALATLPQSVPQTLSVLQYNVRGDALAGLHRTQEARQAYQDALKASQQHKLPAYGVQLKLDDLAPQEAS